MRSSTLVSPSRWRLRLRRFARRLVYTGNTVRYRVEGPRLTEALAQIGHVDRLLDAGAGGGYYTRQVYSKFARRLVALEPDFFLFRLLASEVSDLGDRVTLFQESILRIPLANESVDVAACTQVLEHVYEDKAAFAELLRVVRRNGFLLIGVPHPPAPWPEGGHVREGYTLESLSALAEPGTIELVHFDWYLTRSAQAALHWARRLGGVGPALWPLPELVQTREERGRFQPYGLLALYRKL